MQAYLFDDFRVEIDERAAAPGYCWHGRRRDGIPVNIDGGLGRLFHRLTLEYENPVVLDIGANSGVFSLIAAINPNMHSFAFEPNPSAYDILQRNIALNNIEDKVETFQLALTERHGTATLKVPASGEADGFACIGNPVRFTDWVEFEVPVSTADDFVKEQGIERVDLVKIDTEGCELFVLKGARSLIERWRPYILCECYELNTKQFGYHPSAITKLLESFGYRQMWVSNEDVLFYAPTAADIAGLESARLPCSVGAETGSMHQARPLRTGLINDSGSSFSESRRQGVVLPRRRSRKTIYEIVLPDSLREHVDRNPSELPSVVWELCDTRRIQEALSLVSYAVAKYPDSPDLYNLQAELKSEIYHKSDAKEVLVNLIKRWPSHAKALNNLGVILGQEDNGREALEYFIKSLEAEPYDKNAICNCAVAALDAHAVEKALGFVDKYLDRFPDDAEVRQLSRKLADESSLSQGDTRTFQSMSGRQNSRKDATKVVLTSGALQRFNGGTKIYNLWAKLLRHKGIDANIATEDGSYEEWLVSHEPVISYKDVGDFRDRGQDVRVVSGWLNTQGLEQLVGDGQFYFFDAELAWTLRFRDKLDYYLNKNKIARIGTHSRYIQSWYMANYRIKPILINEWSDESVFYDDPSRRIPGRIGCMPDESPHDKEAFDFFAEKVREYGRGAELITVSGDEQRVADLLRTVDIFAGFNPGKHPFWGEGCPRTQQEALHCGCVLAAFNCLGNREYLYDNWTGLMVPPGDVESLWISVKSLLENPELKERLRANSKSIARGVFSEANKYELVNSFLGLDCDAKSESVSRITKEELSLIFARPFWLGQEEVPYLAEKAAGAGNTIVEIGCAFGGSTTVFLLNKTEDAQVYSIDPFVLDSKGGVQATMDGCRYAVAQALRAEQRDDALDDWHLIGGYSHDVVGSWNKEIDLLFIDGSHHYEDVRRDFQQWSRFLAADGRILIHDSRRDNIAEDPSDQKFSRGWMGPTRLADELKLSADFELVDTCYSINVFVRKQTSA